MSWTDRVVEFPNRVKLTAVTGQDNVYDIEANEGTIYTEGTLLNAANLTTETEEIAQRVVEAQEDYVVERGNEGGWEYVKWKSGKCEAWRSVTLTGAFSGTLTNGWYVRNLTGYRVPSFMTPVSVIANGKWNTGYSWVTVRELSYEAGGEFGLCFFQNSAGAGNAQVSVYAYGSWS